MRFRLQDLIDIERFQNLQDRLNEIYSFPSAIIDNEGNILTATGWQDICTRFHRKNNDSERYCIESDRYILSHLHEANPAVSYRCPHGLVDNATPIIIDGIHYGNFFTGQFFLEPPDVEFFKLQAKRFGFDETPYLEAVRKVPIWSRGKLNSYLFFIKGLIAIVSESGLKRLKEIETRKQIEESEERSETILREMHDGFLIMNTQDSRFVDANEAICRMLGYPREELLGMSLADIEANDSPELIVQRIQQFMQTGSAQFESRFRRKDGAVFDVEVNVTYLPGRELFFGFYRDITERKRGEEEREKLHAQLLQAQKMELVGRLAGGVAHDFNNMLGIIIGNAEMAALQVNPADSVHQSLQEILRAGHRSADTVRQLLAFARKQTISPRVLDLNGTVSGMLNMLRRLIGESIDLVWVPGHGLSPVKIDPSQVNQILANLAVNARDAIAGVGKVTVETDNVTFDEAYCIHHEGFLPGQYVLLSVSDSGAGMSKDILEHLFEPFFTTKGLGKGTGLGLSTIYGIVKQNDGFINVYSEPGQGTTFKIYLPRYAPETVEKDSENERKPVQGGSETVLMVEDEEAILKIGKTMLESLGYAVLTADNPREAIRIAREHSEAIDLLLTDVVMPEMNGNELARELRPIHPEMKCIFMSGYAANLIAHPGVLDRGANFIQKPFSMADLAQEIRRALDKV